MTHDTIPPFAFPAFWGRKITADFDGGRLTSDGGVMLLAMAERRLGIAARQARLVAWATSGRSAETWIGRK